MVKHIVMFQLSDFSEGKTKKENTTLIKSQLENLQHLIPELKKIEVGIQMEETAAENYDLVLYTEFENVEDLQIYINHPEHKKVSAYIGKVKTGRVAVDYKA